jgi:hypothetical protein
MTVMMRMEFWYIWARIAIAEADRSVAARARFGTSTTSADSSLALDDELNSGVLAVCASAFSLEALTLILAPIAVPNAAVQAWSIGTPTNAVSRLRETLKHSLTVSGRQVDALMTAAEPVIRSRDAAVHYIGDFEAPVPHPVAGYSHQDMIRYGADKAADAVKAMRAIYRALLEHPKPAVRTWVGQQQTVLERLAN